MTQIEGPTETIYAIKVADWLWKNGELHRHLIQDVGGPDRSRFTSRRPFTSKDDLDKIDLLKSKYSFLYILNYINYYF